MTKNEALRQARQLRAQGKVVKVFERSAVYCQPGKGLAVALSYEVRVVA